jgi:hypothetical protein
MDYEDDTDQWFEAKFGKRTKRDRYAAQVSLRFLQQLESHPGVPAAVWFEAIDLAIQDREAGRIPGSPAYYLNIVTSKHGTNRSG